MDVELLPLLKVQRELLDEPRGWGRFQSYLKSMVGGDGELRLPLAAFNPMSKPHVAKVLDGLIAMDAEGVAAGSMAESGARLKGVAALTGMGRYRCGLVVADDAQGGWTNRYQFDAKERFENRYGVTHGLIGVLLWSSEEASAARVRVETMAAVYRTAWIWRWGAATTLGEMLRQEGMAARFAGVEAEGLDEGEAEVLRGALESRHCPVQMACLYGDEAAASLGYDGVGVGAWGGLRFAASREFLGDVDAVEALS